MIFIEPLTKEFLPNVVRIRNASIEFLDDQRQFSLEETTQWFEQTKPNWFSILKDGEFVGYIRTSNATPDKRSIYIGADVDPDHRGNGYAYSAYLLALNALSKQGYQKAELLVQVRNYRAYCLYRKLGFIPTTILTNNVKTLQGEMIDSIHMERVL